MQTSNFTAGQQHVMTPLTNDVLAVCLCRPIIGSLVKFPSIFAAGVNYPMQDAFAFLFLPTI
jgi:hypothetical protein